MTQSTNHAGTRLSLLSRARARDASAWSDLVHLYGPLIGHWCRRCGLDPDDTADCVQEVFAAVAGSLEAYRPSGASGAFRAWLWTITRNKVRDLLRRKSRQPWASGDSAARQALAEAPAEAELPTDEPSEDVPLGELIQRGLEQVRCEFETASWQSFWRTVIDGLPTDVVARELGLTPAAVRQNRSRIMRRLRRQLGDLG